MRAASCDFTYGNFPICPRKLGQISHRQMP
jgi:hypothetical protein